MPINDGSTIDKDPIEDSSDVPSGISRVIETGVFIASIPLAIALSAYIRSRMGGSSVSNTEGYTGTDTHPLFRGYPGSRVI